MTDNYIQYIDYYQSKISNDGNSEKIYHEIDNITHNNYTVNSGDYPVYNDKSFIENLSNKFEYKYNKSLLNINELNEKCERNIKLNDGNVLTNEFELTNNQQFLGNFINNNTPYKSLLIFHGTGVGKTCTAINISSSFRDSNMNKDERIIALVSKNIRGSWKDTIYDKNKDSNQQCSGDSFEDIINIEDKRLTNRKVNTMIKNFYEFYGYLKFANMVKKLIYNGIKGEKLSSTELEEREKRIINQHFSNRILIIDEIHNLREDKNLGKGIDGQTKFKKGMKVYWEDESGKIRYGEIISTEGKKSKKLFNIKSIEDETIHKVPELVIDKSEENDKKAREIIEKVIKYSTGLRLIIMSATPMFNKSTEIIWLLNLLLKNDNRPIINYEDVFEKTKKGDKLTEKGMDIIKSKSKGYVSYLRGENPISFPIRLYPDSNNDKLCMMAKDEGGYDHLEYPTRSLFNEGKRLISSALHKFKFMKIYNTQMINNQLDIYRDFISFMESNRKKGEIRLSDRNIGLQISNVVYSSDKDEDYNRCFGRIGYDRFINENIERKRKRCSYINPKEPLFDRDNLINISCKFNNILSNLSKSKSEGIIFIYSDYIYSGLLPMALALEHLGFEKYGGQDILDYPEWKEGTDNNSTKRQPIDHLWNPMSEKKGKRAKYIILSGDTTLSPNNNEERKKSMAPNNSNGEEIKIILGNAVTSEGMDFKNIREIHVLDPWYHLYKIEQIIGRGIRLCSHSDIRKDKRNVTVYLHTSSIKPEIESIDTNTYRIAEEKASQIGYIEKILKENAIDSILNKQINHIKNMKDLTIVTSRKVKKTMDVNDKEYSKVCSFIKCGMDIQKLDKEDEIDMSTYTIDNIKHQIKLISKIISESYRETTTYILNDLLEIVNNLIDTNDKIIYHALDFMIDNKVSIWNNNRNGYIIKSNIYYVFQPREEFDTSVPLYYRNNKKVKDTLYINYDSSLEIQYSNSYSCSEDYNAIYEGIKIDLNERVKNIIEEYKVFEDENTLRRIIKKSIIDRLIYEKKVILLKEILCEHISTGEPPVDKIDNELFKFFKDNLIRKDENGEYSIYDKSKDEVVGFFLFNTKKYNVNKDKNIMEDFSFFIYEDTEWKELDNIGKLSIKDNFKKNKTTVKTTALWGYSFKDEEERHLFKIVDSKSEVSKTPGRVIGNEGHKPITLIKELSNVFPKKYQMFMDHCIKEINKTEEEILDTKRIDLYLSPEHEEMSEKGQIKDFTRAKKEKKKEWEEYLNIRKGNRREKFSDIIKGQEDETEIIKLVIEHMRNITNWLKWQKKNTNIAKNLKTDAWASHPLNSGPIQYVTKGYLIKLFEYSFRASYKYLPYDIFLLKYGF
uniref:Helicase/UvrB N-terminal domain-containing protein n=1 Tax=viral metagenome TaxID=1070528 RepID=A0A6C0FBD8_9ZZZZ|tara:strand:- start:11266 stop:15321 length:4056 start_codon:yes stop_codon:yes gene_type:complete